MIPVTINASVPHSRSEGAAELFVDGVNAVGTPPGDERSMAAAVDALLEDDERGRVLGANAGAHVVARFGRGRFARELQAALSSITSGAQNASA